MSWRRDGLDQARWPGVLSRFVLWPAVILVGIWFGLREPIVGGLIIGGYWVLEMAIIALVLHRIRRPGPGPQQRRDA